MAEEPSGAMHKDLHTLFSAGRAGNLTDGQLLERFVAGRDPLAFEAIVERHGAMVLRVCHATLDDPHDAQDAFQATFLVLVKKAHSIRHRDSIASWLFGVAGRISLRAKVDVAKRRTRERRHAVEESESMTGHDDFDLAPLLHEELRRLPEKYRVPVVLCYLEGQTYDEAASQLHWPMGTVKTRLFRARDLLRTRLTRRGLTLPAGLLAAGAGSHAARATPPALIGSTVQAALAFSSGQTATTGGLLSTHAVTLAEGVLRTMSLTKMLAITSTVFILGATSTGAGVLALRESADDPGRPPEADHLLLARPPDDPRPAPLKPQATATLSPEGEAIHEALLAAAAIQDPEEKAEKLLNIANAQIRRGDRAAARETLELAVRTASTIARNANIVYVPHVMIEIARAQAKAGDAAGAHRSFQRSIALIQAMPAIQQLNHWLNLVLRQLEAEGLEASRETIGAYRHYLKTGSPLNRDDILTFLVGIEARVGGIQQALATVLESEEFLGDENAELRTKALISIVDTLTKNDRDVAGPVLAEATAAVDRIEKNWPRTGERARIAQAQARLSRFEDAIAMAKSIRARSWPPQFTDEVEFNQCGSYLDIAEMQLEVGDKAGARASALLAFQVARTIESLSNKTAPLLRVSDVLCRSDDLPGSLEAAEVLREAAGDNAGGVVVNSLLAIAAAQQKAGDRTGARNTLVQALTAAEKDFRRRKPQPAARPLDERPESLLVYAARPLASVQVRLGDIAGALRTVDSLEDKDKSQHILIDIAGGLAQDGDVKTALALVEKVTTPEIKREAWMRVASCLPAESRPENARPLNPGPEPAGKASAEGRRRPRGSSGP